MTADDGREWNDPPGVDDRPEIDTAVRPGDVDDATATTDGGNTNATVAHQLLGTALFGIGIGVVWTGDHHLGIAVLGLLAAYDVAKTWVTRR